MRDPLSLFIGMYAQRASKAKGKIFLKSSRVKGTRGMQEIRAHRDLYIIQYI